MLFPEPEGPTSAVQDPAFSVRLMEDKAWLSGREEYVNERLLNTIENGEARRLCPVFS